MRYPSQDSEAPRNEREGTPCFQVLWEAWEPASGSIQDTNQGAQHDHLCSGCQPTVQTTTSREHLLAPSGCSRHNGGRVGKTVVRAQPLFRRVTQAKKREYQEQAEASSRGLMLCSTTHTHFHKSHTPKESQTTPARHHPHSSLRPLLSSWTGHLLPCSPLWMQGEHHQQTNKSRQGWRQGHEGQGGGG